MASTINYEILGADTQIIEVELKPGEGVRGEAGAMIYMDDGVEMQTSNDDGIFRGFKPLISGEGFCVTSFVYNGMRSGRVAFGAPYPGKVLVIDLDTFGGSLVCQKDCFLCAPRGTDIETFLAKRIGSGVLGGEGICLHRLEGQGPVFLHAGGSLVIKELQANQRIHVDAGCLVAFSSSVEFDVGFVGGFQNELFGGEGVNLAQMTGPGVAYLQSVPLSRLADRVFAATHVALEDSMR